jgi:hypothetical protein
LDTPNLRLVGVSSDPAACPARTSHRTNVVYGMLLGKQTVCIVRELYSAVTVKDMREIHTIDVGI